MIGISNFRETATGMENVDGDDDDGAGKVVSPSDEDSAFLPDSDSLKPKVSMAAVAVTKMPFSEITVSYRCQR